MYLGIDIGGTKTLLASLDDQGQILASRKFPTPQTYGEFLSEFEKEFKELGFQPAYAAAGFPGFIDRTNGLVISYGHRNWQNTPVVDDFSKILVCPVVIENDGKLGGLAEAISLIDDYKRVLYLAIGTGIGIAYTANGIIDTNISDGGGHTLMIEHDGMVKPWEDFASGSAIVAQFGKMASELDDPEAWKVIAHNIGLGAIELITTLKPDVIVVGGGVGAHFDKFREQLEVDLKQYESPEVSIPPLFQAKHAEQAVIYGGYHLIKQAEKQR